MPLLKYDMKSRSDGFAVRSVPWLGPATDSALLPVPGSLWGGGRGEENCLSSL